MDGSFPPNISGGLGTACYGLTKGLSSFGDVDVTFVVPKVFGGEDTRKINLIGASDVSVTNRKISWKGSKKEIEYLKVDARLVPYLDPEEYRNQSAFLVKGIKSRYVMPSVSEPFGISPLEAMQAGVPVIISKQSGAAEILSNAIKIDFWDIDAMADAIYRIISYPGMSKSLSTQGRKESFNLKWTDSAHQVKKVYHSAISA